MYLAKSGIQFFKTFVKKSELTPTPNSLKSWTSWLLERVCPFYRILVGFGENKFSLIKGSVIFSVSSYSDYECSYLLYQLYPLHTPNELLRSYLKFLQSTRTANATSGSFSKAFCSIFLISFKVLSWLYWSITMGMFLFQLRMRLSQNYDSVGWISLKGIKGATAADDWLTSKATKIRQTIILNI